MISSGPIDGVCQKFLLALWPALNACLSKAQLQPLMVATEPSRWEEWRDPFDQSKVLYLEWRADEQLQGSVRWSRQSGCFAEFDILVPLPKDPTLFVEAVTAWGTIDALKTELRTLSAPLDD